MRRVAQLYICPCCAKTAETDRAAYDRGIKAALAQIDMMAMPDDIPGGFCGDDTFEAGAKSARWFVASLLDSEEAPCPRLT